MPGCDASAQESKRSKLTPESDSAHAVQRINLQLILQHVGPGDWFYMAGVSRRWQQLYRHLCEEHAKQQKTWIWKDGRRSSVPPVEPTATHYTRAFASLGRLQLACSFDLALDNVKCLPLQAGKAADKRTLLWARKQGLPWCEALCEGAAEVGRLSMLRWLRSEQQCPCDLKAVVAVALKRGDLRLLKHLHERAVERESDRKRIAGAVAYYMDVLCEKPLLDVDATAVFAWLHNAKYLNLALPYNQQVLADAAIVGGHLGTLQWLCRKGFSLEITEVELQQVTVYSSSLAVRFGHHSMVQYLLENGVGLKPEVRREAVLGGSVQMLRFLVEHSIGCWSANNGCSLEQLLSVAGQHGHTAVLAYSLEQGAQRPQQLWSLAGSGEAAPHSAVVLWALPALQYAVTVGRPLGSWPFGLCSDLVASEHGQEVEWLHTLQDAPCGADCMERR
jgi:hypothetical protein